MTNTQGSFPTGEIVEAVFCKYTMEKLTLKDGFDSTSATRRRCMWPTKCTQSARSKHIALRCFFILEVVEDSTIIIHDVKT